jgi:hypothetical protein
MRPLAAATLLACAAGCGCGRAVPEESAPVAAARQLFELARQPERDDRLEPMFDPESLKRERAGLLDALDALALAAPTGRVVAEPSAPDEFQVAVEAGLPGGGVAHYVVQLRTDPASGFRITWFAGPGVEWPRAARSTGDGLTISAPPGPVALESARPWQP